MNHHSDKSIMLILVAISSCVFSCGLLGTDDEIQTVNTESIVFSKVDQASNLQVFAIQADGSFLRQVTDFGEDSAFDPSWVPGGDRLVFTSFRLGTSLGPALWIVNANGSEPSVLIGRNDGEAGGSPIYGYRPQVSPNGKNLAIQAVVDYESRRTIQVFNMITGVIKQLIPDRTNAYGPRWSPDGQRVAFTSDRDYLPDVGRDIYLIDSGGLEVSRVTSDGSATSPIWLPDGKTLIFRSATTLKQVDLATLVATPLMLNLPEDVLITPLDISPDGNRLLVHVFPVSATPREESIAVLDIDSGEWTQLCTSVATNANPVFVGASWKRDSP